MTAEAPGRLDQVAGMVHLRGWMPPLDGIRGLAILLVMLYHFRAGLDYHSVPQHALKWLFEFGWSGVDLFFVLSGFLITGILLESRDAANRFSSFYARRILRIFPLYYLSLSIVFLLVPLVFPSDPVRLRPFSERALFLTYLQNWQGSVEPPWPRLLVHYWSLAVEEQFYLVWPAVVFLLAPKRVLQIIAGACCTSVVLRIVLIAAGVPEDVIYRITPARMDTLLIGAACLPGAGCLLGCASSPVCRMVMDGPRRTPAGMARNIPHIRGPGVCGKRHRTDNSRAFLCGSSGQRGPDQGNKSILQRFFASWAMRQIGKYSYAAYVWHLLVAQMVWKLELSLFARALPAPIEIPLMILATLAVSMLSYALVERRFLALKRYFEPRPSRQRFQAT